LSVWIGWSAAVVKFAESKSIQIPPNRNVTLQGYIDHGLPCKHVCCVMQPTNRAAIPIDLVIAPSLVSYRNKNLSLRSSVGDFVQNIRTGIFR
jgi:hypothetical protein